MPDSLGLADAAPFRLIAAGDYRGLERVADLIERGYGEEDEQVGTDRKLRRG
jgi:hypothetical protein